MASIRARKNKKGEITSYQIRVYKGKDENGKQLKPYTMNWKPTPDLTTERQIEKELNRQAVTFEEKCMQGYSLDNKQTFAQYANYVVDLKERSGAKQSLICWYRSELKRINQGIGYLKLAEIRPQHLNAFYTELSGKGVREGGSRAYCKIDLTAAIKNTNRKRYEFAKAVGISEGTLRSCCNMNAVSIDVAERISKELGRSTKTVFNIFEDNKPLAQSTILGYHRCISAILGQAEKELLIPYNPAAKTTPPKKGKPAPNYFQPEDIENIRDALETEPIKWKTLVHLLLITGARRGEIAGLKWSAVDFENNRIHIKTTLLSRKDTGIYEDTPKTEQSERYIVLPKETMDLLREYREYWLNFREISGSNWNYEVHINNKKGEPVTVEADYLFVQDRGKKVGYPTCPDSITRWCSKFSERHGLPHVNPHAFRHRNTMKMRLFDYLKFFNENIVNVLLIKPLKVV